MQDEDLGIQAQPGESSELESLYEELRVTSEALAGLIGVFDFLLGANTMLDATLREVIVESRHVKAAYAAIKREVPV
jgi:hypothetical protein